MQSQPEYTDLTVLHLSLIIIIIIDVTPSRLQNNVRLHLS